MASNPNRDLGEARSAIDGGDSVAAVRSLDRARRGYVKARDADGLEHVLAMTELVDACGDDRVRLGRDNLVYAVKQNLRHESRRSAHEHGRAWADPYPDLLAPSEHTGLALTRPVKVAIGAGVVLASALVVAIVVAPWLDGSDSTPTVTLRLLNDTQATLTLRGCDDADCARSWLRRELRPGLEADAEVASDELVTVFRVERRGEDACLPLRVHDGYERLRGSGALAARLSEATPCPGTTVLPVPAESPSV